MKDKNISVREEKELKNLIDEAAQTESRFHLSVSEKETEIAFQTVARKTGIHSDSRSEFKLSGFHFAAAAVFLLFAVGIAYLFTPNKVETAPNAARVIELPDETVITLSGGSVLTYPKLYGWSGRIITLNGEAFFEVTNTGEPFQVVTQNAQITVLGTKFNVRTETDYKTIVYLKEGKVSFAPKNRQQKAVILEAGQLSMISDQHPLPLQPKTIDQSKALGWLQKELSFKNQTLSAIFDELESRYDAKIKVKSNQILQEKLTIYISNPKGIEQTMSDICRAKGLQYRREDDTFTVYRDFSN